MNNPYNYHNNINIVTTTKGDKVITMNDEIFIAIKNHIFEAYESYRKDGFTGLADDTLLLWKALGKGEKCSQVR